MAHFTTSDRLSIYYEDEGQGLPVLCLSGLTRDGRDFDYVAPHLTDVRLIRMDYRGRGRSEFGDWRDYTLQREGMDALELLDHLGIAQAAILGTSRGGLIAMGLAATVKARLLGVALNDIGPELDPKGLTNIMGYLGRAPVWKTLDEAAEHRPHVMPGFANVPAARWRAEVEKFYVETPNGLTITYDPHLRDAVEAGGATPMPDLWPFFDALEGLPVAALRGANSDLLSAETFAEMQRRRPDMHAADVADRGHVPFLDEAESLAALRGWIGDMT
ncbi:alpha/beta fold hydrolase [Pseudaestuariivita sp.]|uniref:alpha/beta fold hydrolase n=1 Tax=Pseudaestuariivita sp. TaxID=2211669 RepID=UPI004059B3FB